MCERAAAEVGRNHQTGTATPISSPTGCSYDTESDLPFRVYLHVYKQGESRGRCWRVSCGSADEQPCSAQDGGGTEGSGRWEDKGGVSECCDWTNPGFLQQRPAPDWPRWPFCTASECQRRCANADGCLLVEMTLMVAWSAPPDLRFC